MSVCSRLVHLVLTLSSVIVTPELLALNVKRMKKENLRRKQRRKTANVESRVCAEMVNAGESLTGKKLNILLRKVSVISVTVKINIHRCFSGWKGATCNVTSVPTETVVCLDTMLMAIEGELSQKISSLS